MARYQVILAYDGTHFLGFQRQGKGRTVQGVVETALRSWAGREGHPGSRADRYRRACLRAGDRF